MSGPFGGDLTQGLPLPRRIKAKGKELPRCLMSRPGALHWDIWITAQREQLFPTLKAIAITPVSAAFRRDQEVEAVAKGHLSRIANDAASGTLCAAAWTGTAT